MTNETAEQVNTETAKTPVDTVIDALDRRLVPQGDRTRLRKAVDRADAPQTGRAGADEGLGRALGR